MVNANEFIESEFINVEFVKSAKSKVAIIIGKPEAKEFDQKSDDGKSTKKVKLVIPVEINGKTKKYVPNKDSIRNMIAEWDDDTDKYVGKALKLKVTSMAGRDSVIGEPTELKK